MKPTINKAAMMGLIIMVVLIALGFTGFIIMLRQVIKSNDDVELTVNVRKGEMSVKKKKNQ